MIDDPGPHRRGTVASVVRAATGPVIVYGTVIPYANERSFDNGRPAGKWDVHLAEMERQGAEWLRIRERFAGLPLVVAGDFNQDRDGSGWYGTAQTSGTLTGVLAACGLGVATDRDVVAAGMLRSHHLVDHICVDSALVLQTNLQCWETSDDTGVRLSDHLVVAIDV